MKVELTPQILGMYVGRPCDGRVRRIFLDIDSSEVTPTLIAYWKLGDVSITPHLRRLESITEEECREVHEIVASENFGVGFMEWFFDFNTYYYQNSKHAIGNPAAWLYLLSRGFDLFGLIDAGLAKEVSK